jgi:hypothetical protein
MIAVNGPKATVTVEGANSRDVNATNAKTMALQAARGFVTRPDISGQSGPYPVNADGSRLRAPDTENCSAIELSGCPRRASFPTIRTMKRLCDGELRSGSEIEGSLWS